MSKKGTKNPDKLYYKIFLFDGAGGLFIIQFRNGDTGHINMYAGATFGPLGCSLDIHELRLPEVWGCHNQCSIAEGPHIAGRNVDE